MENQNFINQIKINSRPITIGELEECDIQWKEEAFNWDDTEKSRFIESILLRLPTPAFYFLEQDDNSWAVIDGGKRMGALKDFILGGLRLKGLEFFQQYENLRFSELPRAIQRRVKTFKMTGHVVTRGLPDATKASLIRRIKG